MEETTRRQTLESGGGSQGEEAAALNSIPSTPHMEEAESRSPQDCPSHWGAHLGKQRGNEFWTLTCCTVKPTARPTNQDTSLTPKRFL